MRQFKNISHNRILPWFDLKTVDFPGWRFDSSSTVQTRTALVFYPSIALGLAGTFAFSGSAAVIESLGERYGNSMRLTGRISAGVFSLPRWLRAYRYPNARRGPGSSVRYGRADPEPPEQAMDEWSLTPPDRPAARGFFRRAEQPGPMPADLWYAYSELDYLNLVGG